MGKLVFLGTKHLPLNNMYKILIITSRKVSDHQQTISHTSPLSLMLSTQSLIVAATRQLSGYLPPPVMLLATSLNSKPLDFSFLMIVSI